MSTAPTARYRLCLLGKWELTGPEGNRVRSVLAQPKRLCLLAYLAIRAEPVTRSQIVALFWPSADESRGRNALSQSLHHLRRSLGPGVIQSVEGDRIHVPRTSVSFDARELLDGGPADAEVGEFFEGWNADDSQPLQEWVDQTRRRVRETAAAATLPHDEEEAGAEPEDIALEREAAARIPASRRPTWARPALAGAVLAGSVAILTLAGRPGRPASPAVDPVAPAVIVLAPLVVRGEPAVDLNETAVHAELVNRLVERLGPGRVVPVSFAQNSLEFHRLLEAQADIPTAYVVLETVVRVDGNDARLTATLLSPGGYGVADGSTSGDFVLLHGRDGLITVPRAIASTVTNGFAPLVEDGPG